MPVSIYKRIRDINTGYLEMIGKRIAEVGETIPSDVMKLQRIYESGTDVREIEWALAEASKKNIKEIKSILSDIAKENYEFSEPFYKAKRKKFIPFEDNESIQRHIEAIARQTVKEYTGLAASAAFLAFDKNGNIPNKFGNLKAVPTSLSETYKIVTDKAIEAASMGYTDYNTAMRQTLKALADSGIRDTVTYSTGYTRRLDTAVRQNILWGIKQCNQETADIIGEEIGADGYEISYHSNPRPTHEDMGGRQYAVGKARIINGVYYPSFSEVEGLLNDYGCLHFKFSIVLGISHPAYSSKRLAELKAKDREPITFEGNEITKYDASQMQRKLETAMRHTNDRMTIATAAHDEDMLNKEIERMRQLTRKYKELSNASGLPTKMERTVSGFGAKTSRKTLTNGENGGIISLNRQNDIFKKITLEDLKVEFSQKGIKDIADKYGINISGKHFIIESKDEHFSVPFYGRTDTIDIGRIDLYPRAFLSEEEMVRTLLHEHAHFLQLKKYGKDYCEENVSLMEKEAYKFEDLWYQIVKRRIE